MSQSPLCIYVFYVGFLVQKVMQIQPIVLEVSATLTFFFAQFFPFLRHGVYSLQPDLENWFTLLLK